MGKYQPTRERRDDLNQLSYSRVSIPESSNDNANKILDPTTSSDHVYYTFEAEAYACVATDQADANTKIDSDTSRKKFLANEFGWWNRDEIPDGSSVWAQAVADSSTFVNLENRKDKSL